MDNFATAISRAHAAHLASKCALCCGTGKLENEYAKAACHDCDGTGYAFDCDGCARTFAGEPAVEFSGRKLCERCGDAVDFTALCLKQAQAEYARAVAQCDAMAASERGAA